MKALMNLVPKKVEDLAPGELVRMDFGTASGLALLLSPDLEGDAIIGVLGSPDFETPLTWSEANKSTRCLSYSTEWFIEEHPGPETAPGRQLADGRAPVAFYDRDGLVLRFRAPRGFAQRVFDFNTTTGELTRQTSSNVAPLDRWSIWANEDHFRHSKQLALFEWPVPAAM